ncbi:hypothetical protein V6N13_041415 [Hibiscus sabdariffa]
MTTAALNNIGRQLDPRRLGFESFASLLCREKEMRHNREGTSRIVGRWHQITRELTGVGRQFVAQYLEVKF